MGMTITVVTLFPDMFTPLAMSIPRRAQDAGLVALRFVNPRDFTADRHRTVDDAPYGGGAGMVMKPDPLVAAVCAAQAAVAGPAHRVLLCPQGVPFSQDAAARLALLPHLILLCGHYEGVDERVRELAVDEEISIGDFVVTGGELPAMVVADAVIRLLPGAIDAGSAQRESFTGARLDYPQYTRPLEFEGRRVPDILTSGHHAEIERWRRREALRRTWERRQDLLAGEPLTPEEQAWIAQWEGQGATQKNNPDS